MAEQAEQTDTCTFTHSNGHVSGYAHYGEIHSTTIVFYFHGLPSSRLEGALLHDAAQKLEIHLIAVDRPGIGLSSVMRGRNLLDWPPLITELASHLKIPEFHVLGSSGGGPYALACARALLPSPSSPTPSSSDTTTDITDAASTSPPQSMSTKPKLLNTGIIAGMSPVPLGLGGMSLYSKFTIQITRFFPSLGLKIYDWTIIPAAQNPDPAVFEKLVSAGFNSLSMTDKELMSREDGKRAVEVMVKACREHFRQGKPPLSDEWRIFVSEWGFELGEIGGPVGTNATTTTTTTTTTSNNNTTTTPDADLTTTTAATISSGNQPQRASETRGKRGDYIQFWCGEKDDICPVHCSRRMASRIDGAKLTEFADATHYSIFVEHGEQILRELVGR